jgi:predicted glycosyltransferase
MSSLLISDSQSMSVEAAMLGVPSLRYSSFAGKISVLEELEHKYNLTYGIQIGKEEELMRKLDFLLSMKNLSLEFQTHLWFGSLKIIQ